MHSPEYYKRLFNALESTLIQAGNKSGLADMRKQLDEYKGVTGRHLKDADYYSLIVEITFYSGFNAATVDAKLGAIKEWFPDYETVARYESDHVQKMMADPRMIRNKSKLWSCIKNAQTFQHVISEHRSFNAYVDSFAPKVSFKNLMTLRNDLMNKFEYLGGTTSLHFLMEIGMPVLKPDIVVTRIFHRLGFIEDERIDEARRFQCVETGLKFAEATGHPVRYIDIVFVAYGQVSGGASIQQGICLKTNPRCHICGVSSFCDYFKGTAEPTEPKAVGQLRNLSAARSDQSSKLDKHLGGDDALPTAPEHTRFYTESAKVILPTWGGRRTFQYDGSVKEGTRVYCGKDFQYRYDVPADQYAKMLAKFSGEEVSIGTSRTTPPNGSLGEWLTNQYGQFGMTSYIGPILIREGYAVRGSRSDRIRFNSY